MVQRHSSGGAPGEHVSQAQAGGAKRTGRWAKGLQVISKSQVYELGAQDHAEDVACGSSFTLRTR